MSLHNQYKENILLVQNKLQETLDAVLHFKEIIIKAQRYELAVDLSQTEKNLLRIKKEFDKSFHPFRIKHGHIPLIYIHGLNSDATSRKFLNIKEHFSSLFDVCCVEWRNDTDISTLISLFGEKYKYRDNLVVIGDSTGGNFAYQFKERRKAKGEKTVLLLLNPLLDFEQRRTDVHPFPENVKRYLLKITSPEDVFLLIADHDEIINHDYLTEKPLLNTEILQVNDSHRLSKFLEHIGELERYILSQIQRSATP